MDHLLELGGTWLATIHAFYGVAINVFPAIMFVDVVLLIAAKRGLFLLPDRPSRTAAVVVVLAIATVALAAHRRSDTAVRRLVNENPLLNRALDISVGLTQIKPRTAQTASVLATGRMPDDLPEPVVFAHKDVEPLNASWSPLATAPASGPPPFPVPASRRAVASALHDARSNLETCALILSLDQSQWEAANPAWGLRGRPDILATLYQIGFARSKPHGAPRSNAFGTRVRNVYEQPWLHELLDTASQLHPSTAAREGLHPAAHTTRGGPRPDLSAEAIREGGRSARSGVKHKSSGIRFGRLVSVQRVSSIRALPARPGDRTLPGASP